MKVQDIYIIRPENEEQAIALKAFAKALKLKFEVTKQKAYNKKFVEKIEKSLKQIEDGVTSKIEDIDEFLGIN